MESVWNLILFFAICAFIGWIIQAIVDLLQRKEITNTGFLYGPFIPIYGFTALIIYFFNLFFGNFPLSFLLVSYFLLPTGIEYFTGFFLEKLFKIKLWDYSDYRFNIKGRISLAVSSVWLLLILFQVFVLQKIIFSGINQINEIVKIIVVVIFCIYFIIDLFYSAKVFYYFPKVRKEIERAKENFNLKDMNKKLIAKIKSVSKKVRISPVFRMNLSEEAGNILEEVSKK
jgi:uncharacterized membrane protein